MKDKVDAIIEAGTEATDDAVERTKNLIPWLPDPHTCEYCGAYCDAETEYVATQAEYIDVWVCPDCETRYYRSRY